MRNGYVRFLVVSALAITAATSLQAGGWSVITLSEFPDQARYGEPLTLNFTVRQHGVTPVDGLTPKIKASMTGGPSFEVTGAPAGQAGRYEATVKFPRVGNWTIRIDGGFNANDTARTANSVTLPTLTVVQQASESRVAYSDAERGQRLFVAKGCITCHRAGAERDLTGKRFDASYLKAFLADPSIRTKDMPNLGLREHEIAAMAAFVNGR